MIFEKLAIAGDETPTDHWQVHCANCGVYLDPTIAKNREMNGEQISSEDFKESYPDANIFNVSSMTALVNQTIPRGWTEKHFRRVVHASSYFHMHMEGRQWATHSDSVDAGAVAYSDACRANHQAKSSNGNLMPPGLRVIRGKK